MKDRCLIDTNIWLYALIHSKNDENKHQQAVVFLEDITSEIVVSTQVVNEISSNLLRKANKDNAFLHDFLVGFISSHTVVDQSSDDLLLGSTLRKNFQFSFWDSLVIASALNNDCTVVYSEDMQDGLSVFNRLQILNPLGN